MFTAMQRLASAGDPDAAKMIERLSKLTGIPVPNLGAWGVMEGVTQGVTKTPSTTPSQRLNTKEVTPPTRARVRRSKIVKGDLPGTEVLRGPVWEQVETLARIYRQLFERPCFVTENVVKVVAGWMARRNGTLRSLDEAKRLLYLRASVPAWNASAGREERWSKGSLQGLFDERGFYAGKQSETLYDNLLGRFTRLPTSVKEIVDGNGDARLFEAAAGNAAPERSGRPGVGSAQGSVPSGFFPPD